MIKNYTFNTSIICVDDEEGVLESYREVLTPEVKNDLFSGILNDEEREGEVAYHETKFTYSLFLANSGEKAVEYIANELAMGHQIAAGFFDMRMPGGIDGYETIKRIKQIDPQIFCAIVTAYYDRTLEQIRQLFPDDHQDELLYFKKPFSALELKQTAFNMVSAWNRKRNEENQISELARAYESLRVEMEERERLHSELRHARKMEIVGRLAGGIAHDFNNMLTPIIGYSNLAILRLPDDHPVKEYVKIINETGNSAAKIVKQLLAFSRKQILDMQPAHLDEVIVNMSKILASLIGENIKIELDLKQTTRKVLVDTVQIEQLVMNIAVNARDAMSDGGHFTISVAEADIEDSDDSNPRNIEPGKYVILRLRDTGSGIEPELLEKIFEPFYTTKQKEKGTGLGLATVYGIVMQHNGYIYVDSEVGKGTCFTIYFPETHEKPEESATDKFVSMPTGTETILVAEDNQAILKLIRHTLKPLGYNMLEAENGSEALRVSREYERDIDILLTDVVMPGMNGLELADKLYDERPGIKVIFMSGYTDDVIAQHGLLSRKEVFLPKPLYPGILTSKLRQVIDGE